MADIINNLLGMDDAALAKKLGFSDKVDAFKLDLTRADKLTGDARTKIVSDITKMFAPNDYAVSDLGWKVDHAEKKAAGKTTPSSVLAGCCDCAPECD